LLTISARQLSPHKGIPGKTQQEQGDDEDENGPGKSLYKEHYSRENGDDKQEEIRDNILPRDRHRGELFRAALVEEQGAQPAFAKRTGPAVIVTVRAMPADQPELKDKDENEIRDNSDDAMLEEDVSTDPVDQKRYQV
jgi:hypothetical protein